MLLYPHSATKSDWQLIASQNPLLCVCIDTNENAAQHASHLTWTYKEAEDGIVWINLLHLIMLLSPLLHLFKYIFLLICQATP